MRSATRGNPQRPRLAFALRDVDPPHRRWEAAAGRQPIPELVEVVLKVSLELFDRLAVHAGRSPIGSHAFERFPNFAFRNVERLCPIHEAPPVAGWPHRRAERCNPFAPAPLQRLQRYYGLLRPSTAPRYARLAGASLLVLLPSHRRQGSHVPCLSLTRTRAASMPDAGWAAIGPPPNLVPGIRHLPGFDIAINTFDTSSAVCLRSPSRASPDGSSPPFPQRSAPRLLTAAPCGGLEPASDRRLRGAMPSSHAQHRTSFRQSVRDTLSWC